MNLAEFEPHRGIGDLMHWINNYENFVLHGRGTKESAMRHISRMREMGSENETAILDFFEANLEHERSNEVLVQWGLFLRKYASGLGKNPSALTREEVQLAEARFPAMAELNEYEDRAMRFYRSSGRTDWKRKLYDVTDADGLYLGIAYRQAQRITDEDSRSETLDKLDALQLEHIERIKDYGKKAEYTLMWLVRKYAREKCLDHLIRIEHALTQRDLRDKYDLVLTVAGEAFEIQQKTFSRDSNVREYNEAELRAEKSKDRPASVIDLILDSLELNRLLRNEREGGKNSKRRNALVSTISAILSGSREAVGVINQLREQQTQKTGRVERMKSNRFEKMIDVRFLLLIGVLQHADLGDHDKIVEAKSAVTNVVTELLDTGQISLADLNQPDRVKEKIKKALT